jgi:S1-C subfamily serine protease
VRPVFLALHFSSLSEGLVAFISGYDSYAWLGVVGHDLDRDTAMAMALPPEQRGALVIDVPDDGSPDKAGLRGFNLT